MNAFDSGNFATVEPEVITIGDHWVWKRTDLGTDYPPSSYALSYSARLQGARSTAISITTSESGDDYLVEVASATLASYTAGTYSWSDYITRSFFKESRLIPVILKLRQTLLPVQQIPEPTQ